MSYAIFFNNSKYKRKGHNIKNIKTYIKVKYYLFNSYPKASNIYLGSFKLIYVYLT